MLAGACTDQESCNLKVGLCLPTVGAFNSTRSYTPQARPQQPVDPSNPGNPQNPVPPSTPTDSVPKSAALFEPAPDSLVVAMAVLLLSLQMLAVL